MWHKPLQLSQSTAERQEDRKVKESGRERDEPARHLALLRREDSGNLADNERKSNFLSPNFSLPAQNTKLPHYSCYFCSMWIVLEFSDTRITFGGKCSTFSNYKKAYCTVLYYIPQSTALKLVLSFDVWWINQKYYGLWI